MVGWVCRSLILALEKQSESPTLTVGMEIVREPGPKTALRGSNTALEDLATKLRKKA